MDITTEYVESVVTVVLKGRLDAATSKTVEEHLLGLISKGGQRVLIDMAHLEYISSVGLRVLISAGKHAQASQGKLAMCALTPQIAQVFAIAGFKGLFPMFPTRSDALNELR
jgi:anti-anti-sigma factor